MAQLAPKEICLLINQFYLLTFSLLKKQQKQNFIQKNGKIYSQLN